MGGEVGARELRTCCLARIADSQSGFPFPSKRRNQLRSNRIQCKAAMALSWLSAILSPLNDTRTSIFPFLKQLENKLGSS